MRPFRHFQGEQTMDIRTDQIATLRKIIQNSKRAVFFGGAGVSTESGIPDFRSQDGLYRQKYKYPPETILSHTFFCEHTAEFYEFYRDKMLCLDEQPNAAHRVLARLEAEGILSAVVTQNIDGLHQKAGSKNVLELHGSIWRNFCTDCGMPYPVQRIRKGTGVPRCACGGIVKPDVVLYEEPLDQGVLDRSVRAIREADTLIIGGTSLNVYPAAGLVEFFGGDNVVVINRGAPAKDMRGVFFIDGKIGEVLSAL